MRVERAMRRRGRGGVPPRGLRRGVVRRCLRRGLRRRYDGRPARSSRCRFVVRRELRDVVGRGPSGAGAGAGGEVAVGAGWRGGRAARSGAGAWARPRRTPPTLTPTTATTTTSAAAAAKTTQQPTFVITDSPMTNIDNNVSVFMNVITPRIYLYECHHPSLIFLLHVATLHCLLLSSSSFFILLSKQFRSLCL